MITVCPSLTFKCLMQMCVNYFKHTMPDANGPHIDVYVLKGTEALNVLLENIFIIFRIIINLCVSEKKFIENILTILFKRM